MAEPTAEAADFIEKARERAVEFYREDCAASPEFADTVARRFAAMLETAARSTDSGRLVSGEGALALLLVLARDVALLNALEVYRQQLGKQALAMVEREIFGSTEQ